MERPPHNIENCQFLWDLSCGFLGKSNCVDGPAQWDVEMEGINWLPDIS